MTILKFVTLQLHYCSLWMTFKLNVLIFGATGFIGSKLSQALSRRGNVVYILSRSKPGNALVINKLDSSGDIAKSKTNLKSYKFEGKDSLKMLNIGYFVHSACGLLPSSESAEFFKEYMSLIEPTFSIIDSCSELKITFVYLSSAGAIYGDSSLPLSETSKLNPSTFYGFSKYIIEQYIKKKHDSGLDYLILRPANVYGRNLNNVNDTQGLIENSIAAILRSIPIKKFGSNPKLRDFIFVDDFVKVMIILMDMNIINKTLNVGSGNLLQVDTVIQIIYQMLNKVPDIKIAEDRFFDKDIIDIDVSKISKLIPFKPMGIHQGLKKYLSQLGSIDLEGAD